MHKFKFTALNVAGETVSGEREAKDKFALYSDLKKEGLTVTHADEKGRFSERLGEWLKTSGGRVGAKDRIVFLKNLGAMIDAGLSLSKALNVMARQSANARMKKVVESLNADITKGQSLADAMKARPEAFPGLVVSMVKAGEESGKLSEALRTAGNQLENSHNLEKKIRGAMTYPAIVLSVMVIVGILMMTFVVPRLTATFKDMGVDLPWSTRLIIALGDFAANRFLLMIGSIAALIIALVLFLRTPAGKRYFDWTLLRLPVISNLVKETNSARTARTMSSLLSGGVEFVSAINIASEVVQNSYYKSVLAEAASAVQKGQTISAVFSSHSDLYPPFVSDMTATGEETGELSKMFGNIAEYYEAEVEQKTKNLSTLVEPILMVVIGAAVAFFAFSVITPMYSMVNQI